MSCYKKTVKTDGYDAVQLGFDPQKESNQSPDERTFAKANAKPVKFIKEIRMNDIDITPGQEIQVDIFNEGDVVNVIGTLGKGLQSYKEGMASGVTL